MIKVVNAGDMTHGEKGMRKKTREDERREASRDQKERVRAMPKRREDAACTRRTTPSIRRTSRSPLEKSAFPQVKLQKDILNGTQDDCIRAPPTTSEEAEVIPPPPRTTGGRQRRSGDVDSMTVEAKGVGTT